MKILSPHQIASEIQNLIVKSEKYLILVSPFVNLTKWQLLETAIVNAHKRGVVINMYVRNDPNNHETWEQIEAMGITPKLIKNLHSKIYFNEKEGLITSMNLLSYSATNSIEFGLLFQEKDELDELKKYIKQYLEPNINEDRPSEDDRYYSKEKFQFLLSDQLSNHFNKQVNCFWKGGALNFNVKNQFELSVDKGANKVVLSARVSFDEYKNADEFELDNLPSTFEFSCDQYSLYLISTERSSNDNLNFLRIQEKKELLDVVQTFVANTLKFKKRTYEKKRKAGG